MEARQDLLLAWEQALALSLVQVLALSLVQVLALLLVQRNSQQSQPHQVRHHFRHGLLVVRYMVFLATPEPAPR
jgi:hypothetical protein